MRNLSFLLHASNMISCTFCYTGHTIYNFISLRERLICSLTIFSSSSHPNGLYIVVNVIIIINAQQISSLTRGDGWRSFAHLKVALLEKVSWHTLSVQQKIVIVNFCLVGRIQNWCVSGEPILYDHMKTAFKLTESVTPVIKTIRNQRHTNWENGN